MGRLLVKPTSVSTTEASRAVSVGLRENLARALYFCNYPIATEIDQPCVKPSSFLTPARPHVLTNALRGEFNAMSGPELGALSIVAAVERAGVDGAIVDDVIQGCANPYGCAGKNVAHLAAHRAGLPVTVSGATINRFCSSGLQSIAMLAGRIALDSVEVAIAGGVESVTGTRSIARSPAEEAKDLDTWLLAHKPSVYLPVIETADIVAHRYGITRDEQDVVSQRSQQRIVKAQAEGLFSSEIIRVTTEMEVVDKVTGAISRQAVEVTQDTCNRPETTLCRIPADHMAACGANAGESSAGLSWSASAFCFGALTAAVGGCTRPHSAARSAPCPPPCWHRGSP